MTTSDTTHNSYPKEKVECNYTKRESARAKKKTKKHKKHTLTSLGIDWLFIFYQIFTTTVNFPEKLLKCTAELSRDSTFLCKRNHLLLLPTLT
jgi:hypothetical protein